jgi:hypothetical protein
LCNTVLLKAKQQIFSCISLQILFGLLMVKMFSNVTPTTSFSKAHVQPKKLFGGRIIASGEDGGISVADAGLLTGFLQRDVSNVPVTLLFKVLLHHFTIFAC